MSLAVPTRAGVRMAAALIAGTVAVSPVAAAETKAVYDVSFAGFGIAKGSLAVKVDRGSYAAKLHISTSGIARIVSSEESIATVKGRLGRTMRPSSYELMSRGDKVTQVSMGLGGGKVRSLRAIPELSEAEDRVPVTARDKRDVVDPLSAALVPVSGKSGADVCARKLPVFDGWTRYDINLTYKSTKAVTVPGFSGDAVICTARWVPVAGHRANKDSTKFMAGNRDLEAWFVPAGEDGLMLPFKISVKTMKGMLVVQARQFGDPGGKGVAQAN